MKMTEMFLAQLEREVPLCRRALERVPEGKNDWKPHEKSMQMGYLAALVATVPGWIAMVINQDSLDFAPADRSGYQRPDWKTTADLLQLLDTSAARAREALGKASEDHLLKQWQTLARGKLVSSEVRHVVIADTFSHLAHHRGQLTVYLRLNGVAVPSIYGPTADERAF